MSTHHYNLHILDRQWSGLVQKAEFVGMNLAEFHRRIYDHLDGEFMNKMFPAMSGSFQSMLRK